MKRSIISFSLLTVIVVSFSLCEVFYSNALAKKIDNMIDECKNADFEKKAELCSKLKQKFDDSEALNELFFSRELIDKISGSLCELIVYAEHGDSINFEKNLSLLSLCCENVYNAGIF